VVLPSGWVVLFLFYFLNIDSYKGHSSHNSKHAGAGAAPAALDDSFCRC